MLDIELLKKIDDYYSDIEKSGGDSLLKIFNKDKSYFVIHYLGDELLRIFWLPILGEEFQRKENIHDKEVYV